MTVIVSVSELRNNISAYLEKAVTGSRLLIRDQKRRKNIAQITAVTGFDKQAYERALRRAAGIFSVKNHPEWRTQKQIAKWLSNSRLGDERSF